MAGGLVGGMAHEAVAVGLLSRDKRCEVDRKGPDDADEGKWGRRPARMFAVLSIYG